MLFKTRLGVGCHSKGLLLHSPVIYPGWSSSGDFFSVALSLAQRLCELDHIPFVMLSAYSDEATVQRAANLGALGYLVKPLDTASIRPTLEAALQRAREQAQLRLNRDQLQTALHNDRDINVAIGITMVQYRLTRQAAFDMLRAAARSQRRKLAVLAQEVIQTSESVLHGSKDEGV